MTIVMVRNPMGWSLWVTFFYCEYSSCTMLSQEAESATQCDAISMYRPDAESPPSAYAPSYCLSPAFSLAKL